MRKSKSSPKRDLIFSEPTPKCSLEECQNFVVFNEGHWKYNKFCSRSCSMKLKWITSTSLRENQKEAATKSCKKNWENPEYVKIMKDASSKVLKKLWLDNGFREQCSKRSSANLKRLWENHGSKMGSIKGYHESDKVGIVPYRSQYELRAYKILDKRVEVKSYEVETISISYFYKSKIRKYYPDILVTYLNDLKEVIEIKSENFISSEKNIYKYLAAIDYCNSKDMKYTIWTDFNWPKN